MKIRMKTSAMGPNINRVVGGVYDLPDAEATELFEGGYADILVDEKAAVVTPVELATNDNRETAMSPRGRRGK